MDRLHSMRVFAKVLDEGSFAGAARQLHLSPAVVTRLVADLEAHLGARLINRSTRRLALTHTGELYLERVRQILSDVDDAEALANDATSRPRGHLRVLAPPSFAVHQFAPLLPRFRALYPKVTIELSAPGPVSAVDDQHDLSLLLVGQQPLDGEFVARLLARCAWVVCAAPAYLDAHGRPEHPDDLLRHQVMAPSAVGEVTFHRRADVAGSGDASLSDAVKIPLPGRRAALSTHHIDTLCAAARAGLGIAGLPSFVAAPALRDGSLERVMSSWHLLTGSIYAAMPSRKYMPARTRALLDFLVDTFGGKDHDPWLDEAVTATAQADRGAAVWRGR